MATLWGVQFTSADLLPAQPRPERIANLDFFLTHDAPAGFMLRPRAFATQLREIILTGS